MALDNSDFKCDASKIYGGVSSVAGSLDPLSMGIDLVGGQLGLPPAVRNAAKLGIGALMGNPIAVVAGATGLAAEATKEEPAATQYAPKSGKDGKCTQGYAATAVSPTPKYGSMEAMDMNSPEFMAWVPSDSRLAQWRQLAVNCNDPETKAYYMAQYQAELKIHLGGDPAVRADFEAHFNAKLESGGTCGKNEILIRRQQTAPCDGDSAPRFSEQHPHDIAHAPRGGGLHSPASSSSSSDMVDRLGSKMDSYQAEIDELMEKEELSEKDQLKLQQLMQKKQQMFTLLSTLMSIQNQMAMTAIQNMKG